MPFRPGVGSTSGRYSLPGEIATSVSSLSVFEEEIDACPFCDDAVGIFQAARVHSKVEVERKKIMGVRWGGDVT